jgi:hypothetical protein
MRIFIDIGHPAHVHYFRHFINKMEEMGHDFIITARDKEVTHILLQKLNINYVSRGKGGKGFFGKLFYLIKGDFIVYKTALKFKPDLFISFASPYAAHAAWLTGKSHIAFDDTEIAKSGQFFYIPFTDCILNPSSFKTSIKKNQILFNGFMELCSLHPNYFKPDKSVLEELGVQENEKYIIVRFVSWAAQHDFGYKGLNKEIKLNIINQLRNHSIVFISSEGELPPELQNYQLKISPEKMHDALYYATLLFGESGTMTSEAAMLGTPAIQISGLPKGTIGTLNDQQNYGLVYIYEKYDENILNQVYDLINDPETKAKWAKKRNIMLSEKIDVTSFMIWFISNFPKSKKIMKENPDFQLKFK